MKNILVVSPGYPQLENIYNNAFVHSRVKQYVKKGISVDVFSVDKKSEKDYEYDNVKVMTGDYNKLSEILKNRQYDKICIHFAFKRIVETIINEKPSTPLLIWVHGVEALGWYRRLFTFNIKKPHRFLGYMFYNMRQMLFMRKLIKNKKINTTFIFVSEWMKNILETDTCTKNKITQYEIIPNVIDESVFVYSPKKSGDRFNILSIRPYASKKYANDLSVEAVIALSKKSFFNKLTFNFYGDGKLFDKTLTPIKKFNNVIIHRKFLNQSEIVEAHKKHGIMLIPTRQDAQGVSMCEAMSSGLVPITSNNTAIPEYVTKECGYLTDSAIELALAIEELIVDEVKFKKLSRNAASFIMDKCSSKVVIEKELNLING